MEMLTYLLNPNNNNKKHKKPPKNTRKTIIYNQINSDDVFYNMLHIF